MLLDQSKLIDITSQITGMFEGGGWGNVTGNFDGMGISLGLCQWNPGTGSLQRLLRALINKYGNDVISDFFKTKNLKNVITPIATMDNHSAIVLIKDNVINPKSKNGNVLPQWKTALSEFMTLPEMVETQKELFEKNYLTNAIGMLNKFLPEEQHTYRSAAFFMDVSVQNGSMKTVEPISWGVGEYNDAITFARLNDEDVATTWEEICSQDIMATHLINLAFLRAQLSRPEYQWDVFSRKTTIACRLGTVHKTEIDLTTLLED